MIFPHSLTHYSVDYDQDTSGGPNRSLYVQAEGVACFYQPAPSSNRADVLRKDTEQAVGVIYMTDGATWGDVAIDHIVEVSSVKYRVVGKKDLCALNRVYRLDVREDISGEL